MPSRWSERSSWPANLTSIARCSPKFSAPSPLSPPPATSWVVSSSPTACCACSRPVGQESNNRRAHRTYHRRTPDVPPFMMSVLSMEIILGSLTFTGSLMAAGKLQEILPQRPLTYKGQNFVNLGLLAVAVAVAVALVMHPEKMQLFPVIVAIPLVFGVMMIIPIGGADMPTVISLLNSYAGLSAAAMGFVLQSKLLIIAGALDGASGFILSVNMSKAMNRSFTNVLFGAFGQEQAGAAAGAKETRSVRSASPEEAAGILAANKVVIVPGYGMAVAQAQHKVRELYDALTKRGVDVKFGIHPV